MASDSATDAPLEIELKLAVPPAVAATLVRHPALLARKRGRARTASLVATYFDTRDGRLARAGIAVRIRREGGRWIQTAKGPAQASSTPGLPIRTELSLALPQRPRRPPLDVDALLATPWRGLVARALRRDALVPRFTTAYVRTTIPVDLGDGTTAEVCLDRGRIRTMGGERGAGAPICELEIELTAGDPARVFALAMLLADDLPLAIESRSKAERGFALLAPMPPAPVHATPVDLASGLATAQALRIVAANCLRQIEANARGVQERSESEYVHQMRVGVRRLRSCLQIVGQVVPEETSLAPLVTEVRWLAAALGPARDLDVLLEQTLVPLVAAAKAEPEGALSRAVGSLRRRAIVRRRRARADAREAVGSKRFQRLLLMTGQLCAMPAFGVASAAPEAHALGQPVGGFAHAVVARRHRQLLRAGSALAQASPAERHAARIAAKKLRYAIEFFVALFPSKRARAMIKALSRLQDALGRANDWQVARRIAGEIAGEDSQANAVLAAWSAAQQSDLEREVMAAWGAILACRKFWKR